MNTTLPATVLPDLTHMLEIPEEGTLSRTVFQNDCVKAVLFAFDARQEISEHTSARVAVIEVLSGELELQVGDVRHQLAERAWVYLPANTPHAVRALTSVRMLLTLIGN